MVVTLMVMRRWNAVKEVEAERTSWKIWALSRVKANFDGDVTGQMSKRGTIMITSIDAIK